MVSFTQSRGKLTSLLEELMDEKKNTERGQTSGDETRRGDGHFSH
jgi:hypothetical protein